MKYNGNRPKGKPAVTPDFWPSHATQRALFNEPFTANVLGVPWPHTSPDYMPPSRHVFDGLGGKVIAWELNTIVSYVIDKRPDRLPHLAHALRRHIRKYESAVHDIEEEMAFNKAMEIDKAPNFR